MPRVKKGVTARARHKKVLKLAKGYWGGKSKRFRVANEQILKSYYYAFRDRRVKKRDFRKLWITRINAAARMNDISYSRLMNGLKKAGVVINRKMLAELAISEPASFGQLVAVAKKQLKQ